MGNATNLTGLNGNDMKLYKKYLVCYDIENNKVRSRFFDELKDLGLIPLQKSVFWGDLSQAELQALQRLANDMLDANTDKFFWAPSPLELKQLKQGIGYQHFHLTEVDGHATL